MVAQFHASPSQGNTPGRRKNQPDDLQQTVTTAAPTTQTLESAGHVQTSHVAAETSVQAKKWSALIATKLVISEEPLYAKGRIRNPIVYTQNQHHHHRTQTKSPIQNQTPMTAAGRKRPEGSVSVLQKSAE